MKSAAHSVPFVIGLVGFLWTVGFVPGAEAQRLFVGLENATLVTRSSDLSGFPNVTWVNHYPFEVNGATANSDGLIYLCNGAFTTRLYTATLDTPPQYVTNTSVDLHGLGYGGGRLYGFSNFASPMGIYLVNPTTGACTLLISTASPGYRFFGLDFNTADGMLYGYTEYGVSGLYRINVETGEMTRIVGVPPNVNGQGRALAVGNNTVYLLATRGDEGEPCFAYDLAQGPNGQWTPFTNPYPNEHATGGAAWIPPSADVPEHSGLGAGERLHLVLRGPNPTSSTTRLAVMSPQRERIRLEVLATDGRIMRLLADREQKAGSEELLWDGRDDAGRPLASGTYFVRLERGLEREAVKVSVVH
jgi:hypothetical protein